MDVYLAAAADALTHRATAAHRLPSAPDEDAYYARSTWNLPIWIFDIPVWVGRMVALVRTSRNNTSARLSATRHT